MVALTLNAFDTRSFRVGSGIELNEATKLNFGPAYTSYGISAAYVSGGTMNVNGVDINAGISRHHAHGSWLNLCGAGIIGLKCTIQLTETSLFTGRVSGAGRMLGVGLRW